MFQADEASRLVGMNHDLELGLVQLNESHKYVVLGFRIWNILSIIKKKLQHFFLVLEALFLSPHSITRIMWCNTYNTHVYCSIWQSICDNFEGANQQAEGSTSEGKTVKVRREFLYDYTLLENILQH